MSVRQRVRKKHRRVALDSEEEDDYDNGYEQQARRVSVAPQTQTQMQRRRSRQSEVLEDEDVDADDSDVKMEQAAYLTYPVRSKSLKRQSKPRRKQSRDSSTSSSSHTSSPVKKKSRYPPPQIVAVTDPMSQEPDDVTAATAASIAASPRMLPVMLTIGDWLDVMDYVGVWNVGQVLSIPSNDTVEVRYDGWGREYNEVVSLNSSRVAPFHTFTWSVKCWAKYLNWPWWPAIMTVRTPGNEKGAKNLQIVERVYVDFVDNKQFATRCRCWVDKRDVLPFDESFEQLRKKTNGAAFEFSLKHVLKSTATTKFPTFVQGTLPKQYEGSATIPVRKMKKIMGNAMWLKDFANNRERHNRMHGCQGALLGTQEGIDEVAVILGLQEELTRQLRERKKKKELPQTPTQRRTQDGATPSSASQHSPQSPRIMPSPAKNVVMPKNVIFNNDDIIIEDDDIIIDDDDEDKREDKRNKRVKRVQQQHQRRRRSRSTIPTPTPARRRSFKGIESDESDKSSESEESKNEAESEEDAGPALPPRRAASEVVREITAKERNDSRKQQLLSKSVAAKTKTMKRPRSLRFGGSVHDVKTESHDDEGGTREKTLGSPNWGTEDEDASEQDNANSSNDSDGDEAYGFTTEEHSEERLLDDDDAANDDNDHHRISVVSVAPAPSPTSTPDIETEEMVEVKPEIENWTQKKEPIVINSSPEVTNQELVRSKSSTTTTTTTQRQAIAASLAVTVPPRAKKTKKKSPPRKLPNPAPRAKAKTMMSTKCKPPRTLMDTRIEQAQAAIRALDKEEEQNKQDALSSVTEWRSLDNLRRVKAATVRSRTALLPLLGFPSFCLPVKSSAAQQQLVSTVECTSLYYGLIACVDLEATTPLLTQPDAVVSEESNDDGGEDLQGSIVFPGLSDPTPNGVDTAKKKLIRGGDTTRKGNGKRKFTGAEEKEELANQKLSPLSKENRAVNHQREPEDNDEDEEEEKDGEDVVPQLRRRFCMMRASARVGKSRAVQRRVRKFRASKNEPQMFVLAPNKFSDPLALQQQRPAASSVSKIALPVFGSSGELSHSMLRIADPAGLALLSLTDVHAKPAFNSSSGFSLNSWFKQTLS